MEEVGLLEGMLSRYSPTGSEAVAVGYLVEWMGARGMDAFVDSAGNAVGSLGDGPREIILLGHIDTVPGEIPVRLEGDTLWGRGAVDAKGPLACFTSAAARLRAVPGWKVSVVGAVAEEGDSHGCIGLFDRHSPEMVIIGEPSGWDRITLGYKGSAWLRYEVKRPVAHSASLSGSAAEAAVAYWNNLVQVAQEYNEPHERIFEQLTPSLRGINSHSADFVESAQLEIGLRLPPGLSVQQAYEMCKAVTGDGELTLQSGMPAWRSEKNTPLVRALLAAIRRSGGQPGFVLKSGSSDMNLAGLAWKCPIVAYGPGDSELDHTPDEHILIPEYLSAVQVLVDALVHVMDKVLIEAGTKS